MAAALLLAGCMPERITGGRAAMTIACHPGKPDTTTGGGITVIATFPVCDTLFTPQPLRILPP